MGDPLARNAGFAFAASFSEELVNGVLRAYHASFAPAFPFTLPSVLPIAGLNVNVSGGLVLLPPRVSLSANANNTVNAQLAFAGEVTFAGGPAPGTYEVVLAVALDVGLIAQVTPSGNQQTVTAGIDLTAATVDAVTVSVYAGTPLDQVYMEGLSSQAVLSALTTAVRAVPAGLTQVTPSNFTIPEDISVPYNPPAWPPPADPRILFDFSYKVTNVVVRPINAASGTAGALAIGIDIDAPKTQGDPSALIDFNSTVTPVGYAYIPNADGTWTLDTVQDPTQPHHSQFAAAINGDVVTSLLNVTVSPQLSARFVAEHVAFRPPNLDGTTLTYNQCLTFALEYYKSPLGALAMWGFSLALELVYYNEVQRYPDGYPVATEDIDVGVTVTIHANIGVNSVPKKRIPLPTPPAGVAASNVTFTTSPPGCIFYIDGALVELGNDPADSAVIPLTNGKHTIIAPAGNFVGWTASGMVDFDNPGGNPATVTSVSTATASLEVNGDGTVQLLGKQWDPYVTSDYWSVRVSDLDIALPAWVAPASILLGPIYIPVATIFAIFSIDAWIPDLVSQARAAVIPLLQPGINDAISDVPLVDQRTSISQFPATNFPDFSFESYDLAVSDEGLEAYVNVRMTDNTATTAPGYEGSIPYLLLTDQDVSDPSTITLPPAENQIYPVRIDGSFAYPLASTVVLVNPSYTWSARATGPIGLVLKVPPGLFNPNDPTVQVNWTVKSATTGNVVQQSSNALYPDNGSLAATALSLDHGSAALQHENGFTVLLTLTQVSVSGIETLFTMTLSISITDHFDRTHPFVQWGPLVTYYYPGIPYWNATPAAAHTKGVRRVKETAVSRIHRTDIWTGGKRCLVAETSGQGFHLQNKLRNSGYIPEPDLARPLSYGWHYVDTLPLTVAEIEANRNAARGVLCDYCFFGGPTKTALRTDFPTPLA